MGHRRRSRAASPLPLGATGINDTLPGSTTTSSSAAADHGRRHRARRRPPRSQGRPRRAARLRSGTSSKSSKLIHGGLRYLQQGLLKLVFEGTSERAVQMEVAPHLVRPIPFLVPVYRGQSTGLNTIDAGLWLYDALALFRVPKIHRTFRGKKALGLEPGLATDDLQGILEYYDCLTDDARLVLENILDAKALGADVRSYTRATAVVRDANGRVVAVRVLDELTNTETELPTTTVVVAAGPWTDTLLPELARRGRPLLRPTKGVHVVSITHGCRCRTRSRFTRDKRAMFCLPWVERTSSARPTPTSAAIRPRSPRRSPTSSTSAQHERSSSRARSSRPTTSGEFSVPVPALPAGCVSHVRRLPRAPPVRAARGRGRHRGRQAHDVPAHGEGGRRRGGEAPREHERPRQDRGVEHAPPAAPGRRGPRGADAGGGRAARARRRAHGGRARAYRDAPGADVRDARVGGDGARGRRDAAPADRSGAAVRVGRGAPRRRARARAHGRGRPGAPHSARLRGKDQGSARRRGWRRCWERSAGRRRSTNDSSGPIDGTSTAPVATGRRDGRKENEHAVGPSTRLAHGRSARSTTSRCWRSSSRPRPSTARIRRPTRCRCASSSTSRRARARGLRVLLSVGALADRRRAASAHGQGRRRRHRAEGAPERREPRVHGCRVARRPRRRAVRPRPRHRPRRLRDGRRGLLHARDADARPGEAPRRGRVCTPTTTT